MASSSWELLHQAGAVAIVVFVVASTAAIGMGHSASQILVPFRNVRFVLFAFLANFVVVPFGSLGLATALHLDEPLAEGLLLLGAASGAPLLPNLVGLAKGDVPFAAGTMVLLTAGTLVYLPLLLPWLITGVVIDPLTVARPLLLFMLLPLAAGLALRALREPAATQLGPIIGKLSSACLVPLIGLIVALNIGKVVDIFGSRGILAAVLLAIFGLGVGWLLGGPGAGARRVLALSTGLRNFAVALVVASQSFEDPRVEIMVIVAAAVALMIVLPTCRIWSLRTAPG
jgi:BASS family bile acid:Na+ symporter